MMNTELMEEHSGSNWQDGSKRRNWHWRDQRKITEDLQPQGLKNPDWGNHQCNREEVADLSLMPEHQQNSELIPEDE